MPRLLLLQGRWLQVRLILLVFMVIVDIGVVVGLADASSHWTPAESFGTWCIIGGMFGLVTALAVWGTKEDR